MVSVLNVILLCQLEKFSYVHHVVRVVCFCVPLQYTLTISQGK